MSTKKTVSSTKNTRGNRKTSGRTRKNTKTVNRRAKENSFLLGREIRGIILLAFAALSIYSVLWSDIDGFVGPFLKKVYTYGFGIGALLIPLALLYWGWLLVYNKEGFSFTKRGVLIFFIALFGLALYPLWSLPVGNEMMVGYLPSYGGVIGNGFTLILRRILGSGPIGIFADGFLLFVGIILLTRISIGAGLRKAGEKASPIAKIAKEKAGEGFANAREQIKGHLQEWNEQRKESRKTTLYDQEKDERYQKEEIQDDSADTDQRIANLEGEGSEDLPRKNDLYKEAKGERVILPSDEQKNSGSTGSSNIIENPYANYAMGQQIGVKPIYGLNGEDGVGENESKDDDGHESIKSFEKSENVQSELSSAGDSESMLSVEGEDNITAVEGEDNIAVGEAHEVISRVDDNGEKLENEGNSSINEEKIHIEELKDIEGIGQRTSLEYLDPTKAYEGAAEETGEVSVDKDGKHMPRRIELPYKYPSLELLSKAKPVQGKDEEVAEKARLLEATLDNFKVKAVVINATQGPTVTRYELEPAPGVKVSKIVSLTDDIALNLAATGIRIEAPIPGKAAIGIEIPNKVVSPVNLRDVLECEDFLKSKGGIPVGLGKDIAGKAVIADLAKMPHLLVAGSTGSGKSVCVNTLIASILFSRKPDEVKMILIDPKMVELSNYNGVPHLMTPVVTDMKKAASVLRWAVKEMEARYRMFAEANVRDVGRYNELNPKNMLPLVVIIIDELADLMMVSPVDIEESICRLAQMARAAGLHLVLATQRPSVDVITGTIKANVPSRISFAVSSQIDSRTILDMAGAEKLLGKGDMLFNPIGASKPVRIQGAFISDDEVERLVDFIKKQGRPHYDSRILEAQEQATSATADEEILEDELLYDAIAYVADAGQASTSMLQRKMRIGFTRAGRLMDTMEQMKIIGPHVGSKPRELLMSRAEIDEKFLANR